MKYSFYMIMVLIGLFVVSGVGIAEAFTPPVGCDADSWVMVVPVTSGQPLQIVFLNGGSVSCSMNLPVDYIKDYSYQGGAVGGSGGSLDVDGLQEMIVIFLGGLGGIVCAFLFWFVILRNV